MKSYPLNQGWLYNENHLPLHMKTECDESDFQKVTIPHTNKMLPLVSFDDKLYQFVSSYRKHFEVPAKFKGKRVHVDFEGAMAAASGIEALREGRPEVRSLQEMHAPYETPAAIQRIRPSGSKPAAKKKRREQAQRPASPIS